MRTKKLNRVIAARIIIELESEGMMSKGEDGYWVYREGESDRTVAERWGVEPSQVISVRSDIGRLLRPARPKKASAEEAVRRLEDRLMTIRGRDMTQIAERFTEFETRLRELEQRVEALEGGDRLLPFPRRDVGS